MSEEECGKLQLQGRSTWLSIRTRFASFPARCSMSSIRRRCSLCRGLEGLARTRSRRERGLSLFPVAVPRFPPSRPILSSAALPACCVSPNSLLRRRPRWAWLRRDQTIRGTPQIPGCRQRQTHSETLLACRARLLISFVRVSTRASRASARRGRMESRTLDQKSALQ